MQVDLAANSAVIIDTPTDDTQALFNIEHVITGSGDDTLRGDAWANVLQGGSGNDTYAFDIRGNGFDQIIDSDGVGQIVVGNTVLAGEMGRINDCDINKNSYVAANDNSWVTLCRKFSL